MENPRTTSARDHDDSAIIDAATAEGTPSFGDSSGTDLARDLATQSELASVEEPEVHKRVQKSDAIEHGHEVRPDRARAAD